MQNHETNGRRFFFDSNSLPKPDKHYAEKVLSRADETLQNCFQYFFDKNYDLGEGPDWFLNPVTGGRANPNLHWSETKIFDPKVGDIKFIWEPSRFAWVYTLVRAFSVTNDNKYIEKFWELFESWLEANQPNMGPNYACGQECAIRLMAMCFAFYALRNSGPSTTERKIKLITAVAVHADRIEKNIDLAISTHTNHSLTEAAGLYMVGMLFPEFRRSDHWLRLGKKVLTNEGLKQIYTDGSYIQHSMNYQRLMLQDFLWVLRLAQLNNDSFCDELVLRITKATEFLYQMQDDVDGRMPNYGANDGALIIPLNSCDYLDYRPVIQALNYLLNRKKLYEQGPWDEDLLWLFGPEAVEAGVKAVSRKSKEYQSGGYYTIRNKDSWAMIRCHSYRDRPGHADMLHVDLWYKGINILRDGGSYMYYSPRLQKDYFVSTAAHNTVEIDNADQMVKGPRFLWFQWIHARLIRFETLDDGSCGYFEGEQYGYTRFIGRPVHRRSLCRIGDTYIIIDDILGSGSHHVAWRWRLCEAGWQLKEGLCEAKIGGHKITLTILAPDAMNLSLLRGEETPVFEGWESLYYGEKTPAPTIIHQGQVSLPVCMLTIISLAGQNIGVNNFNGSDPEIPVVLNGSIDKETAGKINRLSEGRSKCC